MSAELDEILSKYGRKFDFATCLCSSCYAQREVERRITTRQALHSIMGADLADRIINDMGVHWAIVAAMADPRGDGTTARAALAEIVAAGIEFENPSSSNIQPVQ